MYYMTKGFAERGLPGGKALAVLFSIFCILGALGGGNMFQANQAHAQLSNVIGDYPGWITGVIFAVIGLIVFIAIGAWILTATQTFCDVAATSIATGCALNVTDLSGDTTGQAAAAQAAGCSLAGDQLNEGCGWVATLGAVMIAIPSIYEFLVVVLFTAALCGIKNEEESGGGVAMSGIVMNKQ